MKRSLPVAAVATASALVALGAGDVGHEDHYVLRLAQADTCMAASTNNTAEVELVGCNGDLSQLWAMNNTSKAWQNVLTNTCLTMNSITFDVQGENKVMLQSCGGDTASYQRFEAPPGTLISTTQPGCIGPCSDGSSQVCSFSENSAGDWCVTDGETTRNDLVSYESYCSLEKTTGEWRKVSESECDKACGGGTKNVTYECVPLEGSYTSACCDASGKPPASVPCNTLPCDASLAEFLLLEATEGGQCIQADSNSTAVSIAECTGDDLQLWLPVRGHNLVNRRTMQCLTVPSYFASSKNNPPFTDDCIANSSAQQFSVPLLNNKERFVCIGKSATGDVIAVRDSDEAARYWCSAGGTLRRMQANDNFLAVPMCDLSQFANKCGYAAATTTGDATATTAEQDVAPATYEGRGSNPEIAASAAPVSIATRTVYTYGTAGEPATALPVTDVSVPVVVTTVAGDGGSNSLTAPSATTTNELSSSSLVLPDDFVDYLFPPEDSTVSSSGAVDAAATSTQHLMVFATVTDTTVAVR